MGLVHRLIPRTLEELIDPATATLVVWDMQNGMAGHAFDRVRLVEQVVALIAAARIGGVPVTWSRHVLPPPAWAAAPTVRDFMRRQKVGRPEDVAPFMQAGSADVAFLDRLEPAADDLVIEKSTRSFFVGTAAEARFRDRGITTLVLAGASTDQGIEVTARHAFALGFFPVVVEQAVSSRTQEAHDLGLAFLRLTQTDVVNAHDVVRVWTSKI